MNVVLISTYELGRQPFGLASPAAWLRRAGATVACMDLAVQDLDVSTVASADLIAFYLPMHTATRIATAVVRRVTDLNSDAHVCFYGLYAPMNEGLLRRLGADTILGGEFEEGLVALYERLAGDDEEDDAVEQPEPRISLSRQEFIVPDRSGLPALAQYAHLVHDGEHRVVGYTETTRGCKHECRHCPIVPVYEGQFRIVQKDIVLDDIRQQVAAGATHITFGDPDFFNGPGHTIPIVEQLHEEFPHVTYDVTIKIEHLLNRSKYLPALGETGCLFITSAVEAIDDEILEIFDKNHTRADFIEAVSLLRELGLAFNPTFVTFTPWTTIKGYLELLELIFELDLVENIAPVQYAIRLLIPAGSKLLDLSRVQDIVGEFDEQALCYRWDHPILEVDQLYEDIHCLIETGQQNDESRREIFTKVWQVAHRTYQTSVSRRVMLPELDAGAVSEEVPQITEDWFC